MTPAKHKATGFVLRALDYGESDRIITFYTDTFGKLKGIAKGARRSRKRFANAIELFSCSTIIFSRKSREGLALIENCDVIHHYPEIRQDLERTLMASYMTELTDQFTVEGKRNVELFQLLHHFLSIIEEETMSEAFIRFFELRLLKLAGYEPILDRCTVCSTPVELIENPHFSLNAGGIQCAECGTHNPSSIGVTLGTIKGLIMGREIDINKINRLSLSKQSQQESRVILTHFIQRTLGKKLKSLKVLSEIKRMTVS